MKHLILSILFLTFTLTSWAQKEQDFVSHFISLYDKDGELGCTTISPAMFKHIIKLDDVRNDKEAKEILSQIKSMRLLTCGEDARTAGLYALAIDLAQKNAGRYKTYTESDDVHIYARYKKSKVVEFVLISCDDGEFVIIDVTGNMSADFVKSLHIS